MPAPELDRGILQSPEPLAPDHNGHTLFLPHKPHQGEQLFLPNGLERQLLKPPPKTREIDIFVRSIEDQGLELLLQQRAETPLNTLVNDFGQPLLPSEEQFRVQLPNPLTHPDEFVSAIENLKPGYDHTSHKVGIPEDDLVLGEKLEGVFDDNLARNSSWLTRKRKITVSTPKYRALRKQFDIPKITNRRHMQELSEGLETEEISPEFARTLEQFWYVEAHINYYMARGTPLYQYLLGLSRSFPQWGKEETQHSTAIRTILERVKLKTTKEPYKTKAQFDQLQKENIGDTWEQPFPTARQMVIYAFLQEKQTELQYEKLIQLAIKEKAYRVAATLSLVMQDERYHYGGYKQFVEEFLKHDTIGTIRDLMYVAMNYEMPSVNVLGIRALINLIRSGVFTPELLVDGTVKDSIAALKFPHRVTARNDPEMHNQPIPRGYAKKIADISAEKFRKKYEAKHRLNRAVA